MPAKYVVRRDERDSRFYSVWDTETSEIAVPADGRQSTKLDFESALDLAINLNRSSDKERRAGKVKLRASDRAFSCHSTAGLGRGGRLAVITFRSPKAHYESSPIATARAGQASGVCGKREAQCRQKRRQGVL